MNQNEIIDFFKTLLLNNDDIIKIKELSQLLNNKNCLNIIGQYEIGNNGVETSIIDDDIIFKTGDCIIKNSLSNNNFTYTKIITD